MTQEETLAALITEIETYCETYGLVHASADEMLFELQEIEEPTKLQVAHMKYLESFIERWELAEESEEE